MSTSPVLLLLFLVLLLPSPAQSSGLKSRTQVSLENSFNPHPTSDDVILPMPCGLQMVFKTVEIPTQGLLWDRGITLGCENCDRQGMEYYDRKYPSSIAGPFTRADLPSQWNDILPQQQEVKYHYYLIGKYEVSALQWQVMMTGICPSDTITDVDVAPKTEISWYDALDFTKRYTEWLLENEPDSLPRYRDDPKNVGYMRLPTEAEWEYAARGGNKVPTETLNQEDFFPLEQNTTLADYSVYRAEGIARIFNNPLQIGSRKPNPIGLYDTAGNVAEMVMSPFQFSVGGRLHGSAGGFLRKGGGFMSSEGEIMPGRREEIPFFSIRGATASRDMGFRLVLSGINTPDGGRKQELMAEWEQLGERGTVLVTGENTLQELDKLLETVVDPDLKQNLLKLRSIIKDNQVRLEMKESETVENFVRTAVYIIEALRSYAVRNSMAVKQIEDAKAKLAQLKETGDTESEMCQFHEDTILQFRELQSNFIAAINGILNFYKMKLQEIGNYDPDLVKSKIKLLKDEYGDLKNGFMKNMRQNIDNLESHIEFYYSKKESELSKGKILDDILVKVLREDIPMK